MGGVSGIAAGGSDGTQVINNVQYNHKGIAQKIDEGDEPKDSKMLVGI